MQTEWLKGVDPSEIDAVIKRVRQCKDVFDKLIKILETEQKRFERLTEEDYKSPSWSHLAAHKAGMGEAYQNMIDLLTLDKREPNKKD